METDIFKNNLARIIARGKYGTRKVDVAILHTSMELVDEVERLKGKLAAIEAISSNGIAERAA